jgi:hypothetical protein
MERMEQMAETGWGTVSVDRMRGHLNLEATEAQLTCD